ncbi:MAG: response regulator [Serpentinimonas sp.]|jgi:putative two-component system response regulator|nr:response regulator [Serpentinimonas sp.]
MPSPAPYEESIMVVDDEPVNLRLLDKMLRMQGYSRLVLLSDPREVLSHYLAHKPDLILLDINMPHLDGYQVMEALRALDEPVPPPIVVLTAQHTKDYLLRALASGARDFINKPFDRTELMMRVRNLLDAHLAHRMVHDQAAVLEKMVHQRTQELRDTRLQVVQRLGRAAEYRDEATGNHILRMSHICALLAGSLGWSEDQQELLLHASPMHDIGKIGIPDAVLLKPGKFEPAEWEIMKTHAAMGAELLAGDSSELMEMARAIALTHHEKWDGTGYPAGLQGEAIPLVGRIAAIADVFDALTSERPYKRAWPLEQAMAYLREHSGRHFDPTLVALFERELPRILQILQRYTD